MNHALQGRRALVTGSLQGIGHAIALALAQEGCHIVLHGLGSPALQEEARQAVLAAGAPSVTVYTHDVSDAPQIARLMSAVLADGPLDILVNNAGIQHVAPIAEMPDAMWDKIIAVDLSSSFHTMKAAMPGMAARGYGRVVNISSAHGLVASVNKAPYVAAKFGLIGLSKVAALDYAAVGNRELGGVTVNCICPGLTETAILMAQAKDRADASYGGDLDAGMREFLKEKQPSMRTSKPAEIGQLVVWLCHPIAHNITGTAIPIDGGWTSQ